MKGNKIVNYIGQVERVCVHDCFKIFVSEEGKGMEQCLYEDRMSKKVFKR